MFGMFVFRFHTVTITENTNSLTSKLSKSVCIHDNWENECLGSLGSFCSPQANNLGISPSEVPTSSAWSEAFEHKPAMMKTSNAAWSRLSLELPRQLQTTNTIKRSYMYSLDISWLYPTRQLCLGKDRLLNVLIIDTVRPATGWGWAPPASWEGDAVERREFWKPQTSKYSKIRTIRTTKYATANELIMSCSALRLPSDPTNELQFRALNNSHVPTLLTLSDPFSFALKNH